MGGPNVPGDVIRLGLIGCGAWGWRYMPAAVEAGNAVVTHSSRPGQKALDNPHFKRFLDGSGCQPEFVDDWREMVDKVDAFVVATPPDSHAQVCAHLLELGRPVMVEKPFTLSVDEAIALQRIVSASKAILLVNHLHLFAPAYEKLREIVLSARPSRCRVYSRVGSSGPHRDYSALWDYGSHDVAMCLGLELGHPTAVSCMRMPDEFGCVQLGCQRFDLHVHFGPHEANIQVWNGALPKQRYFEVLWEGTRLVYDELEPNKLLLRCNNSPVGISDEKPLTRAVRAFANAVSTGKTDWRFGADVGVVTTRILHTADTGTVHA